MPKRSRDDMDDDFDMEGGTQQNNDGQDKPAKRQKKECFAVKCTELCVSDKTKWCAWHKRIDDVLQFRSKTKNQKTGKLEKDPDKWPMYLDNMATPEKAQKSFDFHEMNNVVECSSLAKKDILPWQQQLREVRSKKEVSDTDNYEMMEENEFKLWGKNTKGWSKEACDEEWEMALNNPAVTRDSKGRNSCLRLRMCTKQVHSKTTATSLDNVTAEMSDKWKGNEEEKSALQAWGARNTANASFGDALFSAPSSGAGAKLEPVQDTRSKEEKERAKEAALEEERKAKEQKKQEQRRKKFSDTVKLDDLKRDKHTSWGASLDERLGYVKEEMGLLLDCIIHHDNDETFKNDATVAPMLTSARQRLDLVRAYTGARDPIMKSVTEKDSEGTPEEKEVVFLGELNKTVTVSELLKAFCKLHSNTATS